MRALVHEPFQRAVLKELSLGVKKLFVNISRRFPSRSLKMCEKLETIYELRMLIAMKEALGIALSSKEERRRSSLQKAIGMKVPRVDENDSETALDPPLFTQFTKAGGFGSGLARNISGGGMAILTVDPPTLGQRLMVHVMEHKHGIEYIFPCCVVARVIKGNTSVSVAFEGTPSQLRIGGQGSGVWQSDSRPEGSSEQGTRKRKITKNYATFTSA
jgi:hypothetical protein